MRMGTERMWTVRMGTVRMMRTVDGDGEDGDRKDVDGEDMDGDSAWKAVTASPDHSLCWVNRKQRSLFLAVCVPGSGPTEVFHQLLTAQVASAEGASVLVLLCFRSSRTASTWTCVVLAWCCGSTEPGSSHTPELIQLIFTLHHWEQATGSRGGEALEPAEGGGGQSLTQQRPKVRDKERV